MSSCRATNAKANGEAAGEIKLVVKFAATKQGRVEITAKADLKRPGVPEVTETRHIGRGGVLHVTAPRLTFGGATASNDGPGREGS